MVRLALFTCEERAAEAQLQTDPSIQPYAVYGLSNRLHQVGRRLNVVELENQIPRPEWVGGFPPLEDIVDECAERTGAEFLPLRKHLLEAREENLCALSI